MRASQRLILPVLAVAVLALCAVGVLRLTRTDANAVPEVTVRPIPQTGPIKLIPPGDRTPKRATPLAPVDPRAAVDAVIVDLADVPSGVHDTHSKLDRWLRGEVDFSKTHKMRSDAELNALRETAMGLPPAAISAFTPSAIAAAALSAGVSFDSIDFNGCCGGGGNVPPDPELAAGPNHLIAAVNVSFEIYDKSGVSLAGLTTFASLFATTPGCTASLFDPNVLYDEKEDRFILAIDGDGARYCVAVSATGDPTGTWFTYAFATNAGATEFFDFPHSGVGEDAIFLGANMFLGTSFLEGRIWALDKMAMYAGDPATSLVRSLGGSHDTPQPLHLHGWNQGTWPTDLKHYFFSATNFNGANHTLWQWDGPFAGSNTFTSVANVDLNAATGIVSGIPISAPQSGGSNVKANDWRPLDFEYRNGFGWTTGTISCNPGGGTVDCVRWAQIDLATGSIGPEGAGVAGTPGDYRFFPDLAVNHCGDMVIGYTKTSATTFPGIWYTGRETTDSPGTLQPEALQRAGDIAYTAFDPAPHRWGDYTGMTIDPDGVTFWYLGEFSKNTGTTTGRWGTNIGSFTFANCATGSTGACCATDGSCAIETGAACMGTYQGDGTICDANRCPAPPVGPTCGDVRRLRARCNDDGSLDVLVVLGDDTHDGESVTIAINGATRVVPIVGRLASHNECCPQGQLTVTLELPGECLAPVVLVCGTAPTGACCATNGTCSVTSSTACTDTYQGDGTTCMPSLCPQPPATGACCASDGTCTETTNANCADTYQGDGTTCVPNLCPIPATGACCAPDGSCMAQTSANCTGAFQGDNTACVPNNCPLPPAGPACRDIRRLRARCNADGTTDVLVVLQDTSHDGEIVTVGINGVLRMIPIVGRFASHKECCPQGALTISLELPTGCTAPVQLNCGP